MGLAGLGQAYVSAITCAHVDLEAGRIIVTAAIPTLAHRPNLSSIALARGEALQGERTR
jgi:hypothetical protein